MTNANSPRNAVQLTSAAQQIVCGGQPLRLSVRLWRDMQLSGRGRHTSLMALVSIETCDGQEIAKCCDAVRGWFVHGQEVWEADLVPQRVPASDRNDRLTKSARGGPSWEPGSAVDVIVELFDVDGVKQRLLAPRQIIQAVD